MDYSGLVDISDVFLGKKRPKHILRDMQDIDMRLTFILSLIFSKKFVWDNLPKELDERKYIIEYILYYYGTGLLFKKGDKYWFLPAYTASSINAYGEPTRVFAYGLNGEAFGEYYIRDTYNPATLTLEHKQNAVLFRNNEMNLPQYYFNETMIKRLIFIWKSLGIQEGLARIKLLVYANTDIAPKIEDIMNSVLGTEDLTFVVPNETGNDLLNDVKTTDFGGNYNPQDLWFDFDKTFNLLLSLNGINNNIESNKKERQTRAEVTSGQDLTAYATETRIELRDIAVKQTKDIFNIDISYKDEVQEKLKQEELERAKAFTGGDGEGGEGNSNPDPANVKKIKPSLKK